MARKGQDKQVGPGYPVGSAGLHQEAGASWCLETVRPHQQLSAVTTSRQFGREARHARPAVVRPAIVSRALAAIPGSSLGRGVPVDAVRLVEHVERLLQVVISDPFAVYVQLREECSVQDAPHRLVARSVQFVRMVEQVKGTQEDLPAGLKLVGGLVELPRELGLLVPDGLDLRPELVLRPTFLGSQV